MIIICNTTQYHLATLFLGSLRFFAPARVRKTGANFSKTEGEPPN